MMQPWIIEELWRREQDEQHRREERYREQIHIDAPDGEAHEDESGEEAPQRGVVIIEL